MALASEFSQILIMSSHALTPVGVPPSADHPLFALGLARWRLCPGEELLQPWDEASTHGIELLCNTLPWAIPVVQAESILEQIWKDSPAVDAALFSAGSTLQAHIQRGLRLQFPPLVVWSTCSRHP
jgi:hypothetical protein